MPTLTVGPTTPEHPHGHQLDYRFEPGPPGDARPPLVFLHEGLGSVELWRTFPDQVRAAAGGPTTLVYSRVGYGRSSPRQRPWPVSYMHREALEVLPEVLARLGLERPVLIGHSDGGSIALLYAGGGHPWPAWSCSRPTSSSRTSPSPGSRARAAYPSTGLRERLARYHDDADGVFWGWNDVWLSAAFRDWNIEDVLPGVEAPVLAIQGEGDEYGTLAQLDAIEAGVRGPFERLVVPGGGHVLHTGYGSALVAAVARFVRSLRMIAAPRRQRRRSALAVGLHAGEGGHGAGRPSRVAVVEEGLRPLADPVRREQLGGDLGIDEGEAPPLVHERDHAASSLLRARHAAPEPP